uniref:Guided entry of tail-anchored proteins factor 1 n=1 Tax=Sciurus vulgaris TaxID=55149 RepID=A0A8D2CMG2_SCIVU
IVRDERWAWLLVLCFVFGCNVLRILLPSLSSFMSRVLQKDAEQESQMRAEIQDMKQELSTVNMMDEFARYARLERKINKMTDNGVGITCWILVCNKVVAIVLHPFS